MLLPSGISGRLVEAVSEMLHFPKAEKDGMVLAKSAQVVRKALELISMLESLQNNGIPDGGENKLSVETAVLSHLAKHLTEKIPFYPKGSIR